MRTTTFEVTITQGDADYLREPKEDSVKEALEKLFHYGYVGIRSVEVTRKGLTS